MSWRTLRRAARVAALALAALAIGAGPASALTLVPPKPRVFFGVSDRGTTEEFYEFADLVGKHPALLETFHPWGNSLNAAYERWRETAVRPILHISTADDQTLGELITPQQIALGYGDDYLLQLNSFFAKNGVLAYIRPLGEPNRCLNPYSAFACDGTEKGGEHANVWYKQAFRRIVAIVRGGGTLEEVNATLAGINLPPVQRTKGPPPATLPAAPVATIWSPLPAGSPRVKGNFPGNYWPGERWVDWAGTDFYSQYPHWKDLNRFLRGRLWRRKPFAITEWAVSGEDEPRFVKRLIAWTVKHPRVRMLTYYDGFDTPSNPYDLRLYPRSRNTLRQKLRRRTFPPTPPPTPPPSSPYPPRRNSPPPPPRRRADFRRYASVLGPSAGSLLGEEGADRGGEAPGFAFDLGPGAVRDPPAGDFEPLGAAPVAVEGRRGVVELTAVGLDDQASVAPEEVRFQLSVAELQRHVDLGPRQTGPLAHAQEEPLQIAPRPPRVGVELLEQHPQPGDTTPPPTPLDQPAQGRVVEEAQHLGLGDRLAQLPDPHHPRQIEQRPLHRGAGDPVDDGPVLRQDRSVAVRVDPLGNPPPPVRRRHVDRRPGIGPQPPEHRRRPMREHRPLATSQHRSHEPPLLSERRVANCIHGLVHLMEAPAVGALANRALAQPEVAQLVQTDHTVLLLGELRDHPVHPPPTGRKRAYISRSRPVGGGLGGAGGHAATLAGAGARVVRRSARWRVNKCAKGAPSI